MIWIPASASLLLLVIGAAAVVMWRRRARHSGAVTGETEGVHEADSMPASLPEPNAAHTDPRVRQFRSTGSNRIIDPKLSAGDLRKAAMSAAEDEDLESEMVMLGAFLQDVRDSLGADEAVYWRWSEKKDALLPFTWSTPGQPRPAHFDMGQWGSLVQWSAQQRLLNFDSDARTAITRLASAPIIHEDRLIGVLSVSRVGGLDRGREHIKSWLPRHAAQVARLVLGAEQRREYGRLMRQGQALLQAAKRFQGHMTQDTLSQAICDTAAAISSASDAALVRWRAEDGRGWLQFATPGFKAEPRPLSQDSLVARTCAEGLLLSIEDVARMHHPLSLFVEGDDAWQRGSLAIVPLKREERVIGAIVIVSPEREDIPPEETTNVGLLGAMATPSLEFAWEMEEVNRRARTDPLTGLYNRRHFDELLSHLMKQTDRFGDATSLIIADVDHFKKVNDTWGHEAGDHVLKTIAEILRAGVRDADICARYGGEEFAMVLPKTNLQGAAELADRLRKQVEARPIMFEATPIPVTISCGVACYPEGVITKEALFAAADRALYEAKSAGRNCVRSARPTPTGIVR
jgi:diguanylate cyclase (GGDEF)-like protein